MKITCYPRYGFTMVELLVVIAIIGLLIALMVPAALAAREASRKMSCRSHLKQLALASLSFETTHRSFPSGGWGFQWQGFSDINSPAGQPGSWTFTLLPYLEQNSVYQLGSYNSNAEQRDHELRIRSLIPIENYVCPSRRAAVPTAFSPSCQSCSTPIGSTKPLSASTRSDYAMNTGDGKPDFTYIDSWPLNYWGPANPGLANESIRKNTWPRPPTDWSGMSWFGKSTKISDVSDGTSNTVLMGEKYIMQDAYFTGEDWGDNEPVFSGFNNDNHRSTNSYWMLKKDERGVQSIGSFGAAHSDGVHFVMVDGSVRQITYSIDPKVYGYIGNRHDGLRTEGLE